MNTYKYIKDRGGDEPCIEKDYNAELLKNKVVLGDDINRLYYVFKTFPAFKKWYNKTDNKSVHEVIFANDIQKIKFDVDMTQSQLDEIPLDILGEQYADKHKNVIQYIIDRIIISFFDVFYTQNLIQLTYNDIIIFNSSGYIDKTNYKYSYHIVLLYKVLNSKTAKFFTDALYRTCDPSIQACIDRSVNKTTQQFRIYGSKKKNSDRVKKIDGGFNTNKKICLRETLIKEYTDNRDKLVICDLPEEEDQQICSLDDDVIKYILDAIETYIPYLKSFVYKNTYNNLLQFTRIEPSRCDICNRVHDNDHTLYLRVSINKSKKISVYEHCRHNTNNTYLFSFNDSEQTESILQKYMSNLDDNYKSFENRSISSNFFHMENKKLYDLPYMEEYQRTETLVIKANMKLGKTKALLDYINKYYPTDGVIIFVTFRVTFSQHIKELLSGFTLYSDVVGDISVVKYNRVIVQLESLHRIYLGNNSIDLLILDESESILSQFNSGLHKNIHYTLGVFKKAISESKYVICMDANISNKTYYLLSKFRNTLKDSDELNTEEKNIKDKMLFHYNTHKNAASDVYQITTKKMVLISYIMKSLQNNEKIVIASNSIKEIEIMHKLICRHYPKKTIAAYTSKTPMSVRKEHYSNIHKFWKVDILMYTPTVSAGLSFEIKWFDCIYGYFIASSCDVETCRQMLGRIRNVKQNKYVLCLSPFNLDKTCLFTNYRELKQNMTNMREHTIIDSKDSNMLTILSELPMDYVYKKSMYFNIWIQNKIIQNKSKKWFITRFLDQILSTGAKIEHLEECDTSIKDEYNQTNKEIKKENANMIVLADDLTQEQYNTMHDKEDLTAEETLSIKKFLFKRKYNWPYELKLNDVLLYNNITTINIFTNLISITKCETIELSLELIRQNEAYKYSEFVTYATKSKNVSGIDNEIYKDIRFEYQYNKHKIVIHTLNMCGFNCLFTPITLTHETFSEYINKNMEQIKENVRAFATEFSFKDKPCAGTQEDKNKFAVKLVNSGLRFMYGRFISKRDNKYSIQKNTNGKLFKFNCNDFPVILSQNSNHPKLFGQ